MKDIQAFVHKVEKETVMNRPFKLIQICLTLSLFVSACTWQSVQSPAEDGLPKAVAYQTLLGKSLNDQEVMDFIASHCSPADQFQLCQEMGMALWVDANELVETIWLYAGQADGFQRYRGQLPYGIDFYDPMWRVEEKLSLIDAGDSAQVTPMAGLPDEGNSPDHQHYWAIYERFHMIVIYDTPGIDEDAYIYAILVNT